MPQMNRGGKFIFGGSVIGLGGLVQLPPQAVEEYSIAAEGRVYLFTGSRSTGGFCVTRRGLLLPSKLGHILTETPELLNYVAPAGRFIPYKGRAYCWVEISEGGAVRLTGGNAGLSASYARNAASFHPQQRHRLHDGRKGAASGEGGGL